MRSEKVDTTSAKVLARPGAKRLLAVAIAALLTTGGASAAQLLGDDHRGVAVSMTAPLFGGVPPVDDESGAPTTTSMAVTTTSASVPEVTSRPAPTKPPAVVASARRRTIAPAAPKTTTTAAVRSYAPSCPGAAPVVDAYGIWVVDAAGTVRRVAAVSEEIEVEQLTWSPDGSLLAFSTRRGQIGGTVTISVVGRNENGERVLASGPEVKGTFVWTPDSRQIVFSTRDATTTPNRAALLVVGTGNGAPRVLASGAEWITPVAAHPDGRRIFFNVAGVLEVVSLDGGGRRELTRPATGGSLSPNGKFLAYIHGGSLGIVDVDSERVVASGLPAGPPQGTGPVRWAPDSSVFSFYAAHLDGLVIARPDGEVVRSLPGVRGDARFSPRSDRMVTRVASRNPDGSETTHLEAFDVTGSGRTPLIGEALAWDWAPHPAVAAVVLDLDRLAAGADAYAVCLGEPGQAPRRLVTFVGRTIASGLQWSPDGSALALEVAR